MQPIRRVRHHKIWGVFVLLLALFAPAGVPPAVMGQTIPTITPTPDPVEPTATSPPTDPTATPRPNPTATSPPNPTATSATDPTTTPVGAAPTSTPTPTATANGSETSSPTPAGSETPDATNTPRSSRTPTATTTSEPTATDEAESAGDDESSVTELATASPVPGVVDETIGAEDLGADGGAVQEDGGRGSLLWVLLLGTALIVAAVILFVTGRRAR